jgi:hypothetical protein
MTRKYSSISVETTLNSGINTTATTITVPSVGAATALLGGVTLDPGNVDIFTVAIDHDTVNEEIVFVTGVSGDTLTISRGQAGTGTPGVSGIAHNAGASIKHVLTSSDLTFYTTGVATANAAIPKTTTTTTGDIIYASSANTPARLAIGSTGQALVVSGGVPSWGSVTTTPRVGQTIQATTTTNTTTTGTTYVDATDITASITPTLSTSKVLVTMQFQCYIDGTSNLKVPGIQFRIVRGSTAIYSDMGSFYTVQGLSGMTGQTTWVPFSVSYLDSPATTSATTYKLQFKTQSAGGCSVDVGNTAPSVVILQEVLV